MTKADPLLPPSKIPHFKPSFVTPHVFNSRKADCLNVKVLKVLASFFLGENNFLKFVESDVKRQTKMSALMIRLHLVLK